MKKIYAFFIGILLFAVTVVGFDKYLDTKLLENKAAIRNHRTVERYWSGETQELVMDENTLPVFGSSELMPLEDYQKNITSFLNGADMNVMTMGEGYFQSLSHTMELGAIADGIACKQAALFVSPQWFEGEGGILGEAFLERFSEDSLLNFLDNKKISDKNKFYVLDRTLTLLTENPTQYSRVLQYKKGFEDKVSFEYVYAGVMRRFWNLRDKYQVYKQLDEMEQNLPSVELAELDFEELLKLAEKQGKANCTNNEFGINDAYWDTYTKSIYEQGEVKEKQQLYKRSVEYDDLRCLLDVAEELDIKVLFVSIPVNEDWYAYQGNLCDEYYKKVEAVGNEYPNVTMIDMTKYADEKYFFKDAMHLGWKGWTRVNEALYTEFKKQ